MSNVFSLWLRPCATICWSRAQNVSPRRSLLKLQNGYALVESSRCDWFEFFIWEYTIFKWFEVPRLGVREHRDGNVNKCGRQLTLLYFRYTTRYRRLELHTHSSATVTGGVWDQTSGAAGRVSSTSRPGGAVEALSPTWHPLPGLLITGNLHTRQPGETTTIWYFATVL